MTGRYTELDSPIGTVWVAEGSAGLCRVQLGSSFDEQDGAWTYDPGLDSPATQQLREYFRGERRRFELDLDLDLSSGSDFQRTVWERVMAIPFGAQRSYGALAEALGRPGSSRAVGAANGANPLAIVVPCHRVVGATGSLQGYAWGLEKKKWLLAHEASSRSTGASGRTS